MNRDRFTKVALQYRLDQEGPHRFDVPGKGGQNNAYNRCFVTWKLVPNLCFRRIIKTKKEKEEEEFLINLCW